MQKKYLKLLVGSYTNTNESFGLHYYEFNAMDLKFSLLQKLQISNVSFLTFHKEKQLHYAVNEDGNDNDRISALSFDCQTNRFNTINSVYCGGSSPCYVSVNKSCKHLFVANYNDGSLVAIPINVDGSLAEKHQIIKHEKSYLNTSHVHAVVLSPDNKFLLSVNLAMDRIIVYQYDSSQIENPLEELPFSNLDFRAGMGPRHLIFSHNGKFVYVIGELNASIVVCSYESGKLVILQELNLMSEDFFGSNSAADLHISLDGKFLYTSNRGDANAIILFEINTESGFLTFRYTFPSGGVGPRNFVFDNSGEHLLVANQKTNNVVVFKIDPLTGYLVDTYKSLSIDSPVFLSFF